MCRPPHPSLSQLGTPPRTAPRQLRSNASCHPTGYVRARHASPTFLRPAARARWTALITTLTPSLTRSSSCSSIDGCSSPRSRPSSAPLRDPRAPRTGPRLGLAELERGARLEPRAARGSRDTLVESPLLSPRSVRLLTWKLWSLENRFGLEQTPQSFGAETVTPLRRAHQGEEKALAGRVRRQV
jgi:hypothetical protein